MIEELEMIDDWWGAMDTYNIDDISIVNEDHFSISEAAEMCPCHRCVQKWSLMNSRGCDSCQNQMWVLLYHLQTTQITSVNKH